jgi:hypothetical protein
MRDIMKAAAALMLICTGARAADVAADGGYAKSPPRVAPGLGDQSNLDLMWDNGQRRWSVAWLSGRGAWVGNDFDASTLISSKNVLICKYKYYTRGAWPNGRWDGIRVAFYSFDGDVPGSMLWPPGGTPHFFKPNNPDIQSHLWVEFDINWVCPGTSVMAAQEQYYKYPACDAFSLDDSTTFSGHSWDRSQREWRPFSEYENLGPYRNAMIRVGIEEPAMDYYRAEAVAPSSLGRVKALYY